MNNNGGRDSWESAGSSRARRSEKCTNVDCRNCAVKRETASPYGSSSCSSLTPTSDFESHQDENQASAMVPVTPTPVHYVYQDENSASSAMVPVTPTPVHSVYQDENQASAMVPVTPTPVHYVYQDENSASSAMVPVTPTPVHYVYQDENSASSAMVPVTPTPVHSVRQLPPTPMYQRRGPGPLIHPAPHVEFQQLPPQQQRPPFLLPPPAFVVPATFWNHHQGRPKNPYQLYPIMPRYVQQVPPPQLMVHQAQQLNIPQNIQSTVSICQNQQLAPTADHDQSSFHFPPLESKESSQHVEQINDVESEDDNRGASALNRSTREVHTNGGIDDHDFLYLSEENSHSGENQIDKTSVNNTSSQVDEETDGLQINEFSVATNTETENNFQKEASVNDKTLTTIKKFKNYACAAASKMKKKKTTAEITPPTPQYKQPTKHIYKDSTVKFQYKARIPTNFPWRCNSKYSENAHFTNTTKHQFGNFFQNAKQKYFVNNHTITTSTDQEDEAYADAAATNNYTPPDVNNEACVRENNISTGGNVYTTNVVTTAASTSKQCDQKSVEREKKSTGAIKKTTHVNYNPSVDAARSVEPGKNYKGRAIKKNTKVMDKNPYLDATSWEEFVAKQQQASEKKKKMNKTKEKKGSASFHIDVWTPPPTPLYEVKSATNWCDTAEPASSTANQHENNEFYFDMNSVVDTAEKEQYDDRTSNKMLNLEDDFQDNDIFDFNALSIDARYGPSSCNADRQEDQFGRQGLLEFLRDTMLTVDSPPAEPVKAEHTFLNEADVLMLLFVFYNKSISEPMLWECATQVLFRIGWKFDLEKCEWMSLSQPEILVSNDSDLRRGYFYFYDRKQRKLDLRFTIVDVSKLVGKWSTKFSHWVLRIMHR